MGVDHLSAVGIVAAGWQPMDTFPKDGTVVEIIDRTGFVCKAQWHSERILSASLKLAEPMHWRHLQE